MYLKLNLDYLIVITTPRRKKKYEQIGNFKDLRVERLIFIKYTSNQEAANLCFMKTSLKC